VSTDVPTNVAQAQTQTADPAALRSEIARTRSDLADTIEALAAKLDVKAQVGSAVSGATTRMKDRAALATGTVSGTADRVRARLLHPYRDHGPNLPERLGWNVDVSAPVDLSARERSRAARAQAIAATGVAGLVVLAVALWAVRRRRR
jgi:hypothetical protein